MKGKLIVIEGTDCSGKETQTKLLMNRLNSNENNCIRMTFPDYETATGKIVGGPYLGKDYILRDMVNEVRNKVLENAKVYIRGNKHEELVANIIIDEVAKELSKGWFKETAPNVDAKVSSLYYAADRKYNIEKVNEALENGYNVILDRYIYSNMAHQGGKIYDGMNRIEMYDWIESLEFGLLELPEPDVKIFLHMPTEAALKLKEGRIEAADQNESNIDHLKNAENAFEEIARYYDFDTIECVSDDRIKSIEEIHDEIMNLVSNYHITK